MSYIDVNEFIYDCVFFSSGIIKESKLEGSSKSKQSSNVNNMDEKDKTESHAYFVKIDPDSSNCEAMEIIDQTSDKEDTVENDESKTTQNVYEDYAVVRRSNSVSKMTQHFKALQEKANVATAENSSQRSARRSSHGVQRYRERKTQGGERFNTQPVTFEEVREAVLQNQRNAALNVAGAPDDEPEPSKLSLAERVRLFNQKIATAETVATSTVHQERFNQRRRPSTRYKTQPVTSEEVEVASRISPLSVNQQIPSLDEGNI